MAERKAVNKYYPPDWTPSKGSINKYVGQHPLRERARKLGQGILVIRFELPYNIWCGGCGAHVGMGVRYNAEKKKVGNYYSTPIYRFRMKCHLCDNYFEIETDPKNCDYNVVSGARRKNERWEPSATETVETTDKEDAKRMAIDAMFKLEHGVEDVQKSKKVAPVIHQLQEVQSVWKDDYSANKLLRKKFREEKKAIKEIKEADDELRKKASLDIPLVPEENEDVEKAKKMKFYNAGFDAHKNKNRKEISTRSWFSKETSNLASDKLPGITLRKRKRSSTEEKDDWKNSVITKSTKTKHNSPSTAKQRGEKFNEEEPISSTSTTVNPSVSSKNISLTNMDCNNSVISVRLAEKDRETSSQPSALPSNQSLSLLSAVYSDSETSDEDANLKSS